MPSRRRFLAAMTLAAVAVIGAGCTPEPEAPTSPPVSEAAPTPTPSPTPSESAAALPAECADIYSPSMLQTLEAENPPLNDPGVTLPSTALTPLQDLLASAETVRCSWGMPSDFGLATNVTLVDASQSAAVLDELGIAAFDCVDADGATVCRTEERSSPGDDVEYARGETHGVSGGVWVSTAWINFAPDGYTEDILATLAE